MSKRPTELPFRKRIPCSSMIRCAQHRIVNYPSALSSSISVPALLKIIKISRKLLTIPHSANPMLGHRIPPAERLRLLRGCYSLHLFYCHICLPYLAWATICCWWIRQHPILSLLGQLVAEPTLILLQHKMLKVRVELTSC